MSDELTPFVVKGVVPTQQGSAVFLESSKKTFVIHMDEFMGKTISAQLRKTTAERPMTHDFIQSLLVGLGAKVVHVVINDVIDGTFYARILVSMANELGKKVLELDVRPSDAIILALKTKKPIYGDAKVMNQTEDVSDLFKQLLRKYKHSQKEEEDEGKL